MVAARQSRVAAMQVSKNNNKALSRRFERFLNTQVTTVNVTTAIMLQKHPSIGFVTAKSYNIGLKNHLIALLLSSTDLPLAAKC